MTMTVEKNHQIIQEAAEWVEELDDNNLTADQHAALANWLLKSPEHVHEFLLANAVFKAWDDAEYNQDTSIDQLLAQKAPEVIPLLHKPIPQTSKEKITTTNTVLVQNLFQRWSSTTIAASLFCLGLIAVLLSFAPDFKQNIKSEYLYTTITGEQRSLPLADGSVVHMNTATTIRIRFEDQIRNIDLLDGEAIFQVAHDSERPFRVHTGNAVTEAVGTVFNVYRHTGQTTVSVIEGKVAIEQPSKDISREDVNDELSGEFSTVNQMDDISTPHMSPRLMLVAGDSAALHQNGAVQMTHDINMASVTSWRLRKLVFERETLATIVREYNRYNKLQIHIGDPALADTRFTGVFIADDPESLISFLKLAGGIKAERKENEQIYLHTSTE